MQRVALGLRYDGTKYHGWQIQKGLPTIQNIVEQAISHVADHPLTVTAAGRTDAGVHATAQVLHFDSAASRTEDNWCRGVNCFLPADIRIVWAKKVTSEFHARYSAIRRRYHYVVYNSLIRPAILSRAVSWYYRPLDLKLMRLAAQALIGEHNFSSFRGTECQSRSPYRYMYQIEIWRQGEMVIFALEANAFLLHMVRNIVGVLLAIGSKQKPSAWAEQVLKAEDRREGGVTASPEGLYLVKVEYPPHYALPEPPLGPFFLG